MFDLAAHRAIGSWKQEAKDEDNGLYFFPVPEAEQLRSGERCFLIDRKGKGKTAVGQSILVQRRPGEHATSLSFKNFPFKRLYSSLADAGFSAPNQYISGWRYLILCHVARLMADDDAVADRTRKALKSAFGDDVREALSTSFARWLSGGIRLEVAGLAGVGLGSEREFVDTSLPLAERADLLRRYLEPTLKGFADGQRGSSRYYIVFDELDEDYTATASEADRQEYFALLTGLLKAVRQIRGDRLLAQTVYPVVMLRDDIFKLLQDPDRAKWRDSSVRLDWSEQRIKELVAFRLSRAAGVEPTRRFDEIWSALVGQHASFSVNGRTWDKFDFIGSYTMLRPRDYIYYLGQASRIVLEKAERGTGSTVLSGEVLKMCLGSFAEHLQLELEDEIGGQVPYIHEVMNVLLALDGTLFNRTKFRAAFREASKKARRPFTHTPEEMLEILYSFSVIGFIRGGKQFYRYRHPREDLDPSQTMLLHKGLTAARRAVQAP